MFNFINILFCLSPLAVIAFFVVSLVLFCSAKKSNKRSPGSYSAEQIKTRKYLLIVSSVVMGITFAIVIGLISLIYMVVAHM